VTPSVLSTAPPCSLYFFILTLQLDVESAFRVDEALRQTLVDEGDTLQDVGDHGQPAQLETKKALCQIAVVNQCTIATWLESTRARELVHTSATPV